MIIDDAGVLTTEEYSTLEQAAEEICTANEIGIYVAFTDTLHGYSDSEFAEYTYYNHGLGWGDGKSGILLAVAVEDRYFDSFSYGAAPDVFTTSELDNLNDIVLDYFRNDDWNGGAQAFLNQGGFHSGKQRLHLLRTGLYRSTHQPHLVETTPRHRKEQFFSYLPCYIRLTTGTRSSAG